MRAAFTLVELLVVIIIITLLIGAVFAAGTTVMTKWKSNATQSVLTVVRDAVDEFKREQDAKPTITRRADYVTRFGEYPADELEKIPLPAGAKLVPAVDTYLAMTFYTKARPWTEQALEHRDLAALVLAIELYGKTSKSILDQISEKYRSPGPLDNKDEPAQFLDKDGDGEFDASKGDVQIRYILDDWGMPLGYFAQRDFKEETKTKTVSSNYTMPSNPNAWNEASTEIIRMNGGRPVIFSYGPNGPDQLTAEAMGTTGAASVVGDFEEPPPGGHHKVDQPLNLDNLYADPGLKEKLAKGL